MGYVGSQFPDNGSNPLPLQWKHRVLTIGPPGKSLSNELFIYLNRSVLEYNCFTILCQSLLHNKANQPYAYTCPHIPSLVSLPPILPIPPLQVTSKHRADLPVLCCCFPPANYFTFGSVYMSMLLSFRPSFPFPFPMSSSPFSMSTSSFLPYNQVHQYHFFFLASIYMRQHTVFVFYFLTSLCMTDPRSIHLTTNNSISFIVMAE